MNLKKGDNVIVIAGRDKGKTGTIQKVIPESNRVVVDGVNIRKKCNKPTQANPDGGIVEVYAPIDASNVALVDPKTKKGAFYSEDYGFWSKPNVAKEATNIDLVYHTPGTGPYWDKKMVSAEIDTVVKEVQNYIGGKR